MKIYIAMAEFEDGNRIFERAYTTREAAEQACELMIKDIHENTDWNVAPIVEDIELVNE
jgi:NADPH-dependent ferric siderophore reductase